jgi:DNA-binding NarL/FixJ family response regulator
MPGSALIIDDHPLYRDALAQLLRTILSEASVRAASSAGEGLRVAEGLSELRLVLLDFTLPGMSGTEAIDTIRRKFPNVVIIAVSASEQRRDATAALRAGAKQFISKAVSTEVMADAIRRVLCGDFSAPRWLTPTGAGVIESETSLLTPRQLEILAQLHLSNKEIGLRLGLAEVTVKMHVSSIFRALNVANRTQATQVAHLGTARAGHGQRLLGSLRIPRPAAQSAGRGARRLRRSAPLRAGACGARQCRSLRSSAVGQGPFHPSATAPEHLH